MRLRTNYRGEDVYLYRLQGPREVGREVFLQYLQDINQLSAHPAWYNALMENCTTSISWTCPAPCRALVVELEALGQRLSG